MVAFTPSFPQMAPTAPAFNYKPPAGNDLQTIMGGLKGTGSTLGLPWAAGNTAQPGITTPMGRTGGPLNPAGVDAFPYGGGPPKPPVAPAAQPQHQGFDMSSMPYYAQHALMATNHARSQFGMDPIAPGTPEFGAWQKRQNLSPAWANTAGGIMGPGSPRQGPGQDR
jgi:hypothetical protein